MACMMNVCKRLFLFAFCLLSPAAALAQVDLVTTLSGPQTATKGDEVTFTITVTNKGTGTATNVRSRLVRPVPLTGSGGAFTGGVFACTSGTEATGAIYTDCPLGTLAPGASKQWGYVFGTTNVTPPDSFRLTTSTKADQADANAANNSAAAPLSFGMSPCAPPVGMKVAFRSDTGSWYARCNGCQQSVNNSVPDTVTIHGTAPTGSAVFTVVDAGGGARGLRADNGKYLARCNGCIVGAPADMLTVHATAPHPITFEKTASGRCALKADNGKYLGRCRGCSPGATTQDTVSIKDTDPNQGFVQVEMTVVH